MFICKLCVNSPCKNTYFTPKLSPKLPKESSVTCLSEPTTLQNNMPGQTPQSKPADPEKQDAQQKCHLVNQSPISTSSIPPVIPNNSPNKKVSTPKKSLKLLTDHSTLEPTHPFSSTTSPPTTTKKIDRALLTTIWTNNKL